MNRVLMMGPTNLYNQSNHLMAQTTFSSSPNDINDEAAITTASEC